MAGCHPDCKSSCCCLGANELRGNSFAELEVHEGTDLEDHVEDYPKTVEHKKRAKGVQRRCTQCGAIFKGSGEFCHNCSDNVIE